MMMRAIGAAVFTLALAGQAQAQGGHPVQGLFGNTLTCKGPSWECRYWFNADGTFVSFGVGKAADGTPTPTASRGVWTIENNKLCRKAIPAPERPQPCTDWEFGKKVGDKWEHTGTRGTEYFVLLAGQQ